MLLMQSRAATVTAYLKSLPPDRRVLVSAVRRVVRANLPKGYKEGMGWGMIVYTIPLTVCPDTYNGQPLCYAGLASQKQYVSLYLMSVYVEAEGRLRDEFRKAGMTLDPGKGCVRFRTLDDLPLDLVGRAVARYSPNAFIRLHEAIRAKRRTGRRRLRQTTRG